MEAFIFCVLVLGTATGMLYTISYPRGQRWLTTVLLLPWRACLIFMAQVFCRCGLCQARALPRLTARATQEDLARMWQQAGELIKEEEQQ